ncbi:MAG: SAM-dependent DNA methyltransferase, partial [Proteobacteria bacterium]|nr:SAM-dependent DNA methyltransferase [Pseudomonadota bacterium]
SLAVASRRSEPPDSLDYFPTPPWATRALFECVTGTGWPMRALYEPACGEGHMASVLAEYLKDVPQGRVIASDVHDYGFGAVQDFLTAPPVGADWIITNPPFNKAEEFLLKALDEARHGVALLLRSVWLHGTGRHDRVFRAHPPATVAPFCERVPMVKGRWDPAASTATDYCWFVWRRRESGWTVPLGPSITWIPPGQRKRLTRHDDAFRFGAMTPAPLLDGGAA